MSFSADLQRLAAAQNGPAQLAAIAALSSRINDESGDASGLKSAVLALGLIARDSANPKVCAAALRGMAAAVSANSACSGSIRFAVVFDRLGDGNALVREASSSCLVACASAISTAAVLERALKRHAFSGKNPVARQHLLSTLAKAMLEYGADGIDVNELAVPHIQSALADSTGGVREAAVDLLVTLFRCTGDIVVETLQKLDIRPQQKSAIMERFEQVDHASTPNRESTSAQPANESDSSRMTPECSNGRSMSPLQPRLARAATNDTQSKLAESWESSLAGLLLNLAETGEDWERPVRALKDLRTFLLEDAIVTKQRNTLVRCLDDAKGGIAKQLVNLRSAVPREACLTISLACEVLRHDFSPIASALHPILLTQSTVTNKVVSDAARSALLSMYAHTMLDEKALSHIFKGALGQHTVMQQRCFEFTWIVLAPSNACAGHALDKCLGLIEQVLSRGLAGAHEESRLFSRRAFWAFHGRWESRANALLATLEPRQRRNVETDRTSKAKFDAVPRVETCSQILAAVGSESDRKPNHAERRTPTVRRSQTAPVPKKLSGSSSQTAVTSEAESRSSRGRSINEGRKGATAQANRTANVQMHQLSDAQLIQYCAEGDSLSRLENLALLQGRLSFSWPIAQWRRVLDVCATALQSGERQLASAAFGLVAEATKQYPKQTLSVLDEAGMVLAIFRTLAAKPQPIPSITRTCHTLLKDFVEQVNTDTVASAVLAIARGDKSEDVRIAAFEFLADILLDHKVTGGWIERERHQLTGTLEMLLLNDTPSDLVNAGQLFLCSFDNQHTMAISEICSRMPLEQHRRLSTLLAQTLTSHNLADALYRREIDQSSRSGIDLQSVETDDSAEQKLSPPSSTARQPEKRKIGSLASAEQVHARKATEMQPAVETVAPRQAAASTQGPVRRHLMGADSESAETGDSANKKVSPPARQAEKRNVGSLTSEQHAHARKPTESQPTVETVTPRQAAAAAHGSIRQHFTEALRAPTKFDTMACKVQNSPARVKSQACDKSSVERNVQQDHSSGDKVRSNAANSLDPETKSANSLLQYYAGENSPQAAEVAWMWKNMSRIITTQPSSTVRTKHMQALFEASASLCLDETARIRDRTASAKYLAAAIKRWKTVAEWRESCLRHCVSVASALVQVLASTLQPRSAELFVAVYDALKSFTREAPLQASLEALSYSASRDDAPESVKRVAVELIGFAVWEHRDDSASTAVIEQFLPHLEPIISEMACSRRADVRKAALFCVRDITLVSGTRACKSFEHWMSASAKKMLPVLIQRKLEEESHRNHGAHDHAAHAQHKLARAA